MQAIVVNPPFNKLPLSECLRLARPEKHKCIAIAYSAIEGSSWPLRVVQLIAVTWLVNVHIDVYYSRGQGKEVDRVELAPTKR